MEMAIGRLFGGKPVRRKKVTAKDIQRNILKIQRALEATPQGTPEWEMLSKELEHEYVVLKKYKDSRFYVEPKQYLTLIVGGAVIVFFVALEREVPSATKFVNLLYKVMPFRGV